MFDRHTYFIYTLCPVKCLSKKGSQVEKLKQPCSSAQSMLLDHQITGQEESQKTRKVNWLGWFSVNLTQAIDTRQEGASAEEP